MPGPFGNRVAPTPAPNPYADISQAGVDLAGINPSASAVLRSRFAGQVGGDDANWLQDRNAEWAAGSGMGFEPGFGPSMANNRLARNLGLRSEELKDKAFGEYSPFVGTVAGTQIEAPGEKNLRVSTNNQLAAAPDPYAKATYAETMFDKYKNKLGSPGDAWNAGRSSTRFIPGFGSAYT